MLLPPCHSLYVATLTLTLVVMEIPGVQQKCIFDEVQAQTRVVRVAPVQPGDPSEKPEAGALTGQGRKRLEKRATLRLARSERLRRRLEETPASPQPIRIHSWHTLESSNLLKAERERLQAAVQEAFTVVSSVLSGDTHTHTHEHTHTHRLRSTCKTIYYSKQSAASTAAQPRHQQILQIPVEEFKHCKLQQVRPCQP